MANMSILFIVLILVFFVVAFIFGWFCGDIHEIILKCKPEKTWLSGAVWITGILLMVFISCINNYSWKNRSYDTKKYEIVNDTIIVNHNGQIDSTTTFKVIKK